MYATLKAFGYVMLVAMLSALAYAAYITLTYWTGIGV